MSCICKYVFLNYSGPNSMRFSWGWTWWIWRGAQRAMDQLCRYFGFTSFPQLHRPSESCACSRHSYLTLMPGWEYFPLQKPLKSWRNVLSLLLGSLTQPRAADFARSIKNTDLQSPVRVAVGAAPCSQRLSQPWRTGMSLIGHCYFLARCWTAGSVYI